MERFKGSERVGWIPYVVVLLSQFQGRGNPSPEKRALILVQKRDSNLWGPIAGGVESIEIPSEAALRELFEETGISPNQIKQMKHWKSLAFPGKIRPALGYVFQAHLKGITVPPTGIELNSDEISLIKPFSIPELIRIQESAVYKPSINCGLIWKWTLDQFRDKHIWPDLNDPDFSISVARSWGMEERHFGGIQHVKELQIRFPH